MFLSNSHVFFHHSVLSFVSYAWVSFKGLKPSFLDYLSAHATHHNQLILIKSMCVGYFLWGLASFCLLVTKLYMYLSQYCPIQPLTCTANRFLILTTVIDHVLNPCFLCQLDILGWWFIPNLAVTLKHLKILPEPATVPHTQRQTDRPMLPQFQWSWDVM